MAGYMTIRVRWTPEMDEPEVMFEADSETEFGMRHFHISGATVLRHIKNLDLSFSFEEDDNGKAEVSVLDCSLATEFYFGGFRHEGVSRY